MKVKAAALSLLLLLIGQALGALPSPVDPLAENLFPPEWVVFYQSEIGLTKEQRETLMADIHKAEGRFTDLGQRLQKEGEALAALLKKEKVEERAALAQFDKVFDQQRELQRAHLALVIGIKNKLSSEQQAKLREIKSKTAAGQIRSPQEVQRILEGKLHQVQDGAQRWQNDGRDPSSVAEIMQEFEPLMKDGKHKEAEALLDRALKLLQESDKDKK
jgi:Spy/CpxP family protein refolding chaperone